MKQSKYRSGPALRTALEERLKHIADKERTDLHRLRRQVAFDRFLSRLLDPNRCDSILKGGYSMELRFQWARTTKDLDFTVASRPAGEGERFSITSKRVVRSMPRITSHFVLVK